MDEDIKDDDDDDQVLLPLRITYYAIYGTNLTYHATRQASANQRKAQLPRKKAQKSQKSHRRKQVSSGVWARASSVIPDAD